MSHFNPNPFGMISKACSYKLELTNLEGELVWELTPRKEYLYQAINEKHKIPNQQALKDVLISFHKIEKWNLEQMQSFGSEACRNILPPKLVDELKENDAGDILFLVPPHAADIPFEFFFIPDKGFLCLIFQISICINYVSQRNRYQQKINKNLEINKNHKFLIISNPDDDQTVIHNEVQEVKNFVKNYHFGTYSIATSNKEILCEEIIKNSIIHFASRSLDTGSRDESGWELSSSSIFNINNIEQMLYNSEKIPELIFSNSCDAGLFGSSKNISGIAGSFLKGGVKNYIAPILKVNTQESLGFALLFYKYLFCVKSPARALFLAKKEMVKCNPSSITPFCYRVYGDHPVGVKKNISWYLKIVLASLLFALVPLLIYILSKISSPVPSMKIITDFSAEELLVYENIMKQFEKENNVKIDVNNIRSEIPAIFRKYKNSDIVHIDINKINSINLEKHFLNISDYINELIPKAIDPKI
ncbi:MAG: CHAT domain-containing protein, partial [Chitinispirillia bacterium]